jgi:hypothetical protein
MNSEAYKIPANYSQVLKLVKQLSAKDKIRLSKELAKETVETRLNRLLESFRTDELSENTINEEVEKVRAEIHARK